MASRVTRKLLSLPYRSFISRLRAANVEKKVLSPSCSFQASVACFASGSEPRSQEVQMDTGEQSRDEIGEQSRGDTDLNYSENVEVDEEQMDDLFQPFSAEKDSSSYKKGSFQDLFRKSLLVRMCNPLEKEMEGVIIAMNNDKVYVDFGGKFHGVADVPVNSFTYCVGAKVIVQVKELEAVGHFIGDPKHNSLMEARIELRRLL